MFFLYNLLFPLLFLFYLPFYLLHIFRRGGLSREYWERFGIFGSAKKARLRQLGSVVWIHAVSVGETVAAISFVRAWQERHPDDDIVFSCGTSTAFATAKARMPASVTRVYCPFDFYFPVRRALNLIRPRLLLIFEVEVWPNLILQAKKRGAKIALINGRMSDRSSQGYARWKRIFRPLFNSFDCLCLQSAADLERVARILGEDPRLQVCGSMKFDQVPDCDSSDQAELLQNFFGPPPRLVFTAGSTHAGEEELVCQAFKVLQKEFAGLKLILVPRHHERAAAVAGLLDEMQLKYRLLRDRQPENEKQAAVDVLLVNCTGELMNFYAVSDLAYVGKSLGGQSGGHNIIEPAIFGLAVMHGSQMQNFREVVEIFQRAKAARQVERDEDLLPALRELLAEPKKRLELGKRARGVVEQNRGSIERSIDILEQLKA